MGDFVRTFVAVELAGPQRDRLAALQAQLKKDRLARTVRWVDAENIHLTLKFLGDVESTRLPEVQRALAAACRESPAFALSLADAGAFPNLRRPNVIWVGLSGDLALATALAKKIDDACAALGFAPEERPFSPHLTLGRVKREASPAERQGLGALIEGAKVAANEPMPVERVNLMKSELRPTGSLYTRLGQFELAGRG